MVRSELEARALAQFDSLVEKGELFWEPSKEIKVEQQPFDVYFRISATTQQKPYNPNDTSRRPGFLDDDPEFTLCHVTPNHKLIMNKFCWLRPQMILHTLDFQSQTDMLARDDFEAAISVLKQLGERYMLIFNGGPDAGSSVAHKHLQVFQRPEWKTAIDRVVEGEEVDLPFTYRLFRLSGANAMLGMLWLKTPQQLENWKSYGPIKALTDFGVVPKTQNGKA
ncbi:hypothetical protein B0A52_01464 [Exophiala mesophila]|uniref:Ap4A phosphorylase 1/2 N-terminal domain-containing protein n=1 Tax=Exophiala mesophila TaxID=212818 RepID=A0A438NF29_EXOME|nr:hypothetical protein B0A52_01464 [Exophiala mesophila]